MFQFKNDNFIIIINYYGFVNEFEHSDYITIFVKAEVKKP